MAVVNTTAPDDFKGLGAAEAKGPLTALTRDLARIEAVLGKAARVAREVVEKIDLTRRDDDVMFPRIPVHDALGALCLHRVSTTNHQWRPDGAGAAPDSWGVEGHEVLLEDRLLLWAAGPAGRDDAPVALAAEGAADRLT